MLDRRSFIRWIPLLIAATQAKGIPLPKIIKERASPVTGKAFKNTTLITNMFGKDFQKSMELSRNTDRHFSLSDKIAGWGEGTITVRRPVQFIKVKG